MATPNWIGATSGSRQLAAQVNQLLGTHAAMFVYTGTLFASQTTAGSGSVDSNGLYVAQSFTTSASTSAIGRVALSLSVTGTPTPLTVQIQTNNAGAPSGTALVTTVIPPNWATGSQTTQSIPLPVTGLSASTEYWVVMEAVGDASDYFAFYKSNQTSGASTSTNGTSWTAQTYGLLYSAYDQTAVPPLVHTWEDSGARLTNLTANANATPNSIEEYVAAQGTNQYVYSYRTYTYGSGSVVKIA